MNPHGRKRLEERLNQTNLLRATGPTPFEYYLWADTTEALIREIFGPTSPELVAFGEAVRERGRTVDQRGLFDNMTLGLYGAWGIWARLDRAQAVLEQILGRYESVG